MNVKELLPIGSVVLLKNGKKKLMVFGVKQTDKKTSKEYDYIGVLYPEGNIGEMGQFLFNHSDIDEVYYRGFENEERDTFLNTLNDFYEKKAASSEQES